MEHCIELFIEIFMIKPRSCFRVVRVAAEIFPMHVSLGLFFPLYLCNFTFIYSKFHLLLSCQLTQGCKILLYLAAGSSHPHCSKWLSLISKGTWEQSLSRKPQWNRSRKRAKLGCPAPTSGPTWHHPVPRKDSSYPKNISKWSVSKKA